MAEPAYALIANRQRALIRSGELPPGSKLPSLRELADAAGVSDIVARQAIRTLATEGLVETRPGAGTYVTDRRPLVRVAPHRYRRHHGTTTYADEASQAGLDIDVEHATTHVPAAADVADRLGIEAGDMVSQTDYLIRMGDQPVNTSRCWEPLDLTRDTEIEHPDEGPHGHLGIVDRFAVIGQHVRDLEEILSFRPPEPNEARRLDLAAGLWVIAIAQAFLADERTVEVADIIYRPDRYIFVYRLPIPTGTEDADEVRQHEAGMGISELM